LSPDFIYFIASLFSLAWADEPKLVIVDNDFTVPPDTLSDLRSTLMFLDNPNVKVLVFTDCHWKWLEKRGSGHLLRLE
jgi:hypothetical protein